MNNMKVLFVSSGNSQFFDMAPFIKSQGESLKEAGVEVEYFPISGKGFFGYLGNVSKLKKKIKAFNPDVVHAHYSLTGWVVVLAFSGKPKLLSLMGSDTYGAVGAEGKMSLTSLLMKLQVFKIQLFYSTIIVKSENLRKALWRKKDVHVIPNGVNFNRFKPLDKGECRQKLNLPAGKKIVLFMGNPKESRKNFAQLEKAMHIINREDAIICAPFPVTHENVPLYLNACDVLAFPSFKEGSPNVIKEAMACNCPIVACDAGDIVEVISGTEGCYLSEFNEKDMAEKLTKALEFGKRTRGRENIQHMNELVIATKLIHIYESIR
jgi:glycosyltransferase involved in cell wall biosynthesis